MQEYDQNNPLDPGYTGNRTRVININSVSVEEWTGNLDNIINKGEKVRLYVSTINTGNSETINVKANIEINKAGLIIDDFDSNLEWGNVSANSVSTGKGGINTSEGKGRITFSVENEVSVGEIFNVRFDFFDELDNHWLDSLSFEVEQTSAVLVLDTLVVIEGTPDISRRFFKYYSNILNNGTSSTQQVWSKATVQDSTILISSGYEPALYGDIGVGEIKTPQFPYPGFRFNKSLQTPLSFMIYFEIYDTYENYWYDSTLVVIE